MRVTKQTRFILLTVTIIIAVNMLICAPVFAVPGTISTLSAGYSSGTVSVSGTTSPEVLAVAVMLYGTDGTTLLRMESFPVVSQSFSASISIALGSGTYTVKAADYNGGSYASSSFTHTSSTGSDDNSSSSGSGSSGSTPAVSATPFYTANLIGSANQGVALPITVDTKSGTGTANLEGRKATDLFAASNVISIPPIPGVNSYKLEMPADFLSSANGAGALTLNTSAASIVIAESMLSTIPNTQGKKAAITVGKADTAGLTNEEKAAVGDRPLIQLTLTLNGEATKWNNSDAPVTVSIPYTPTQEEQRNPESIVVWYLDGSGELVCIPNGRYNPDTGKVTFTTTHFSLYAVGYNTTTFRDVLPGTWYSKAVSFIAARNITSGTGAGNYSPENQLTRGEFVVLLMRAYGIAPDTTPSNNFADAGKAYYTGYLSTAKRLGISTGVGNNLFNPDKRITRQEMATLLYRSLKSIDMLPANNNGKPLSGFSDTDDIAVWAKEAMTSLVSSGAMAGSDGKLHPVRTTTRAEIAQVLYNLLGQ